MARKVYVTGMPYELTMSVKDGLPFAALPFISIMIFSLLAVSQTLYPVTICNVVVMGNHIHFLFVIQNPETFSRFLCRFKTETSHAMNRFLGRTGTTFWLSSDDRPIILSPEKCISRIVYQSLNPVKANLVERAADYPGVHTYNDLLTDGSEQQWCYIPRTAYKKLPDGPLTVEQQQEITERLLAFGRPDPSADEQGSVKKKKKKVHTLKIEPWAWTEAFSDTCDVPVDVIKTRVLKQIEEGEQEYAAERQKNGHQVMGAQALKEQDPRRPYESKRNGKRSICFSDCPVQRKDFIDWYRTQCQVARTNFQAWTRGVLDSLPPPGFFAPGGKLFTPLTLCPVPV
jgi:REP element-mobilizing transposase RayT